MAFAQNRKKLKPRGKPFAKGNRANPGGRPKLPPEIVEVRALAREYTVRALNKIVAIMDNDKAPASAQLAAACEILDRGHGKAPATFEGKVEHDHEHHHVHEPLSETARWIAGILGNGKKGEAKEPLPH